MSKKVDIENLQQKSERTDEDAKSITGGASIRQKGVKLKTQPSQSAEIYTEQLNNKYSENIPHD